MPQEHNLCVVLTHPIALTYMQTYIAVTHVVKNRNVRGFTVQLEKN